MPGYTHRGAAHLASSPKRALWWGLLPEAKSGEDAGWWSMEGGVQSMFRDKNDTLMVAESRA